MSDTFTETTTKSWSSRLGESFKGIFGGIILLLLGTYLLFWNEGRTVNNKRAFKEGAEVVISVPTDKIDSKNEGKLVYISGASVTNDFVSDPDFGVAVNAISLKRSVEMFQWEESSESVSKKKLGGSEETTTKYTYTKVWSASLNKSDDFKKPEKHENPFDFPYKKSDFYAQNVNVGAFNLSSELISTMAGDEAFHIKKEKLPEIEGIRIANNQFYVGEGSPSKPKIGDISVGFTLVKPHAVSIIAKQVGNSLNAYTTKNGKSIQMLTDGIVSSEQMFKSAIESNKTLGWILRLVGLFVIFLGFSTILKPLSTIADVVPFLGNIVGMGSGLISLVLSLIIGSVAIAIAWIFFRPVIGISLLAGAAVLIVFIFTRKKKVTESKVL
jgi:hypothetical protein